MNTQVIDAAIERYVSERMLAGKKVASDHFLAYSYLKNQGMEMVEYMQRVKRYYIDYLKVMQNPFKGPELAWFLSMLSVAIYASCLLLLEDSMPLGVFLLVGTFVNAAYLVSFTAKKWCDMNVMIAIYLEIVQIVDQELISIS